MSRRNAGWLALAIAAVFAGWAPLAWAQSTAGNFGPFNSWWLHPTLGTLGVNHDGSSILIDRDGDGIHEAIFDHSQVPNEAWGNLRLTPTREILYGWGGSCGVEGSRIYFYEIPPAPGTVLTPIVSGTCVYRVTGSPLPLFYDTGLCLPPDPFGPNPRGLWCEGLLGVSPQRIAYIVTNSATPGEFEMVWVNLDTGTVDTTNNTNFRSNFGFILVSPSGTQAFVQHDLPTANETDYTLLDLCPPDVGRAINAGGFPIHDQDSVLRPYVRSVIDEVVTIDVFDEGGGIFTTFTLPDCLAASGPVGACCHAGGLCDPSVEETECGGALDVWLMGTSCSACPEIPITEACCMSDGSCFDIEPAICTPPSGTPQGSGTVCATTTCPAVSLAVGISGASSAREGDPITYTIDYANTGDLAASAVQLDTFVPADTTYVSLTGGGEEAGGRVTWELGDLAAGASGSVTFTVEVGCGSSQIVLFGGSVTLQDAAFNFAMAPSDVVTSVSPIASGQIVVTATSTPAAGIPVAPDEVITHTITLDNPLGEIQPGIYLAASGEPSDPGLDLGEGVSFEAVLLDGGGAFTPSGSRIEWTGDLPPGTTTIRFTTRVDECLAPGTDNNELNRGKDIAGFSACQAELGSAAAPAPLALEQQVFASVEALGLKPPAQLVSPTARVTVQLARDGDTVAVQLRLRSGTGAAQAGASTTLDLRGLGLEPSPFIPPSDPGAVYVPALRQIQWSGTIPAMGAIVVTFEAQLVACRGTIALSGSSDGSCANIGGELWVAGVRRPPSDPYLAALGTGPPPDGFVEDQILQLEPDTGSFETQLCLASEFLTGMGASPNGDVWVGWLPTYRYNPSTLEIEGFDWRRLSDAGMTSLADIAVDPNDGTVYFLGEGYDEALGRSFAAIRRYLPAGDVLSLLVDDPSHDRYERGVVDHAGFIVATARGGASPVVVRVDPDSGAVESLGDGGTGTPDDVDLDADGDYVVLSGNFAAPHPVGEIDETTGDTSSVDSDLSTTFPDGSAWGWGSVAVDPATDDVYVAPNMPGLGVIRRGSGGGADTVIPFDRFGSLGLVEDMHFARIPEPAVPALQAAALACLGWLLRRRRRRRDSPQGSPER